jgi:hypothetical protein
VTGTRAESSSDGRAIHGNLQVSRRLTHVFRGGASRLATAGGESECLGRAVDSPSPPLRSALGPSENVERYTPHKKQLRTASVCNRCIPASIRIQPSLASSRRTPRSSSFSRPRQPFRRRASPPLTRGIVWRAANYSSAAERRDPQSRRHSEMIIWKLRQWRPVTNIGNVPIQRQRSRARVRYLISSSWWALSACVVAPDILTRRDGNHPASAAKASRHSFRESPTRAFRRSSGAGRLW